MKSQIWVKELTELAGCPGSLKYKGLIPLKLGFLQIIFFMSADQNVFSVSLNM